MRNGCHGGMSLWLMVPSLIISALDKEWARATKLFGPVIYKPTKIAENLEQVHTRI